MMEEGSLLCAALKKQGRLADIKPADISELIIRSEKHGAYYHIASAEIIGPGVNSKCAVTTALSESAKRSLQAEHGILRKLSKITPDYLPELFYSKTITWQTDAGAAEFIMVLGEWLDGYHEWHASNVPGSHKQKIKLWDYENGCRFLADAESYEMLRQIAYILTCYYDQASFCQIYPWHHGAGDFIVKPEADTRLTGWLLRFIFCSTLFSESDWTDSMASGSLAGLTILPYMQQLKVSLPGCALHPQLTD
jgi:hypothetical protein